MKKTIGIIGGGNMGTAILNGIRRDNVVRVAEIDKKRVQALRKQRVVVKDLASVAKDADIIILAVKPQSFESTLKELKMYVNKSKLIVSIAAGITCAYIEKRLGKGIRVIRTMPNLPVQVGKGITGIAKGKYAKTSDFKLAEKIFNCIGKTIAVKEKDIDAITAISGSGPAYVYLFIEQFLKAALATGMKKKECIKLISETIEGSFALLEYEGVSPEELRKRVTSKGGTTYAALEEFRKGKSEQVFKNAVKAAKRRAKELSK